MPLTNPENNDEQSLINNEMTKGVEIPKTSIETKSATTPEIPSFGWSAYAERINGRFAMIGLSAVLLIEALTNKTFLNWASFIN